MPRLRFKYIVALNERAKAEASKKAANKGKSTRREAPSIVTPEQKGLAAVLKREPANNEGLLLAGQHLHNVWTLR